MMRQVRFAKGSGLRTMSETTAELLAKLVLLAPLERYEIAYRLLDTLAGEDDPAWDKAWAAEVQRRTEMIDGSSATEEPAEKTIAELRKKYA
jgi:Putative addiction module component